MASTGIKHQTIEVPLDVFGISMISVEPEKAGLPLLRDLGVIVEADKIYWEGIRSAYKSLPYGERSLDGLTSGQADLFLAAMLSPEEYVRAAQILRGYDNPLITAVVDFVDTRVSALMVKAGDSVTAKEIRRERETYNRMRHGDWA